MHRKLYCSLVQELVRTNASLETISGIADVCAMHNANFDSDRWWQYVDYCKKHKEDL